MKKVFAIFTICFISTIMFAQSGKTVSQLEYWINNGEKKEAVFTDGDIDITIDANKLMEGDHTLYYRVRDSEGKCSPLHTFTFTRRATDSITTEKSIPKVAWLKYWWNDRIDLAEKEIVRIDTTAYTFIKNFRVPDYAMTDEASHTAYFRYYVGDDKGRVSPVYCFAVEYPDDQAPVTVIETEAAVTTGSAVLKWHTVSDAAKDYNIYYAEGSGPYLLWLPNTTSETATFKGQIGKSYRFTVTARDNFNNCEPLNEEKFVKVEFK